MTAVVPLKAQIEAQLRAAIQVTLLELELGRNNLDALRVYLILES